MKAVNRSDIASSLIKFAQQHGDKSALRFLDNSGVEVSQCSYGQLVRRASQIAVELDKYKSEYVLLFFSQGIEFVEAFLAVVFSGRVPVPVFAPNAHRDNFRRMESIVDDSHSSFILTDAIGGEVLKQWQSKSARLAQIDDLDTSSIPETFQGEITLLAQHETAFLQYTSGSTGAPKGVIVSHENLLSNLSLLQSFYRKNSDDVFVSWVPVYHDLGLIGNILFPLYLGAECVFMAPETFIRKPTLWLEAIDRYRATISFAPTFAYGYTCNYVKKNGIKEVDLSCWDVCVIGAEPIFKESMDAFHQAFGQYGFDKKIFRAAYGLAESTLMVVTTEIDTPIRCAKVDADKLAQGLIEYTETNDASAFRRVVSSGKVGDHHDMKIYCAKEDKLLGDRQVGEVLLSGPSISKGYHNRQVGSDLALSFNGKQYLRTGDAGFICNDEIYITGRLKDVIIVNGENFYPQDIENLIFSLDSRIRIGCAAAFSVGEEQQPELVVVAEAKDISSTEAVAVFQKCIQEVKSVFGLTLADIALIPPGSIAKTSSGKIQRQLNKKLYLEQKFNFFHTYKTSEQVSPEVTKLRNWLKFTIADMTGKPIDKVDLNLSVFNIGLPSVRLVELISLLAEKLGVASDTILVWEHESVDAWVRSWVHGQ